jgi:Tat protein secretion system quality control protein TatD with DNase activity
LETDAPDMTPPDAHVSHPLPNGINHPANLPAIGIALAAEWNMPPAMLAAQLKSNALRCFNRS